MKLHLNLTDSRELKFIQLNEINLSPKQQKKAQKKVIFRGYK
jgi:hypothetical protein